MLTGNLTRLTDLRTLLLSAVIVVGSVVVRADRTSEPFGLIARDPWTSSRLVGSPDPPPPYAIERAYPQLVFQEPIYIAPEPGTNRLVVAERKGKIYAFSQDDRNADSRDLFLDVGRELYAFSFHPAYEENGVIFVFSPRALSDETEEEISRVSRFTAKLQHPRSCSADSEQIIIQWPTGGHNGGEAIIGPDGYLYISTGDSTSGTDPKQTGQGVDDLLSVVMRIDVEHPDSDKAYSIPADNPFINFPGARPEIWAFGFRNPWRMSFDSKTGNLWVGDVGQDDWEMIWLVERGGNYGWSVQEGSHPYHTNQESGPGPILPPVVEQHHAECRSVTGGYVYHGGKFPELDGVFVYGCYEYGTVWGVRYENRQITWHKVLAESSIKIPSFGVTRDGEILLIDHVGGELYRLVRASHEAAKAEEHFPQRLSDTGLFKSVKDHKLAPGVVRYRVNAPQWCDGAVKQRYFALPNLSQIQFVEESKGNSAWGFEDGSVAAETLSLETVVGTPASRKRIETRVLVKQQDWWQGYSYLWNDAQTDATLVGIHGRDLKITVTDPFDPSGTRQRLWQVPSRNECFVCHSDSLGFVLGLRTNQMNTLHDYGGIVDNQLRSLNHAKFFAEPLAKSPDEYEAMPDPYDDNADMSDRARAYLHVNCTGCHFYKKFGNSKIQLQYHHTSEEANLINEIPIHGTFGLTDGRLVVPGDPYASILLYRLSKLGPGRMPKLGSGITDEKGLDLIHNWIVQLGETRGDEAQTRTRVHRDQTSVLTAFNSLNELSEEDRTRRLTQIVSRPRKAFILSRIVSRAETLGVDRQIAIDTAMAHPDVNVRDLFERFVPEHQRSIRLGSVIDTSRIMALHGNAERGKHLFASSSGSLCRNCHAVEGRGGTLGPDLSQVGKKYKPHELLESLVDPSKKIDPKYTTHVLLTNTGNLVTGIVLEKTDEHVILNILNEGKGERMRFPASEVEKIQPQKKSLMPDGLLQDMTAQQAADLVEFLASLKGEAPTP